MTHDPPRRPQFFYITTTLPCPYVEGRRERKMVAEIAGPEAGRLHDRLSRAGFRRSHNIAYAPVCPGCRACVPIRVPSAFRRRGSMARVWRANAGIAGELRPPRATDEQYLLFRRYQQARHLDGDMAAMSFHDYRAMVEDTPIDTVLAEFRDPAGRLVGGCLADRLEDGYSAVYSFFDPDLAPRSPGSFAILWLLERARREGLRHVYLGYWVPGSRKMAYKARFRPCEILRDGVWRPMEDPCAS